MGSKTGRKRLFVGNEEEGKGRLKMQLQNGNDIQHLVEVQEKNTKLVMTTGFDDLETFFISLVLVVNHTG